ncbi:MAG: monovalent cation/H+ antiporter complex subunit F [Hyphomicrobiales bacterium]
MIYAVACVAVLVAMSLAVARALAGPTVFDRVLAGNAIGTSAIMLLALFGFLTGRPEFLDIGILYALLNIIGTLAVLKFFRYGDLSHAGEGKSARS